MAILHRRGLVEDFDQTKMLPGEIAISTDEPILWFCWQAGKVIKLGKIDNALSELSTNAIQNSVVTAIIHQLSEHIDENTEEIAEAKAALNSKFDGAYADEDGYLYLTSNGEVVEGPIGPFAGGGGGGSSSNNAVLTLTNISGWIYKNVSHGCSCVVNVSWSSLEGDIPTGSGVLKVTVNNSVKYTSSVDQGDVSIELKDYLSVGSNTVKVNVSDIYGNNKTIFLNINTVEISLTSTFDATVPYSGEITFKYIPYGAIEKTIHILVDGSEVSTVVVSTSGKQLTHNLAAMDHGTHTLEVYATAELDGTSLESEHLIYDIMCTETGIITPIIASVYDIDSVSQGEQVSIPYIVYDPGALASDVNLDIYTMESGSEVIYSTQEITVDRSQQYWNTRRYPVGTVYFRIKYGEISKVHTVTVAETKVDVEPETNDLELFLSSEGRSNNEAEPANWSYGDIITTFSGFNWDSNGWVTDDNGDTCLRLTGDARAEIQFKPFSGDIRTYGKTLELEFSIRDVNTRDDVVISCMSGGIGLEIKADTAYIASEQSRVFCNYKDEEKVKLAFVVEARSEYRQLSVYLNGILSDVIQYPDSDNFQQTDAVNICIGSSTCGIDLYTIRSYSTALTAPTNVNNFVADLEDIVDKTEAHERNDIYDEYGNISFEKCKEKNSVMVIVGELPASKGDKKTVKVLYYDIDDPGINYTDENTEVDVQGTSSQWYVRKNWKLKFSDYRYIDKDHLPAKVICIKVDYAECTGTHNTQNANFVETLYSESIPPQEKEAKCRTTIYGKPILLFHQADDTSDPVFYGKANYNYDKGAEHVFGFTEEYDVECWEFCNNTSDACNFLGPIPSIWVDDFEARYPEDYTDVSRFKEMHDWVVSTRQDAATGEALAETCVDSDGVEHTNDTAEYRLAKFKMEFEDHFNMHYSLIYYVYTFFALMVDQRAKNMFLTYWGPTGKWYPYFYDNDTSFGINNEGQLVLDYYHEDTDQIEGANVYNGQNSVLWVNFRQAFPDKIQETYQDLRNNNKITFAKLEERFITNGSDKWSESVYNEDSDFKYISMLRSDNDATNLPQVRGSGEEHFRYFIENRLNYCDSKWYASDYANDYISLRIYTPSEWSGVEPNADITATYFSTIYAGARYKANGTLIQHKVTHGTPVTFEAPDETFNDTETAVYGAHLLSSLGDLAPLYCGSVNVSNAEKLIELKVGDSTEGYSNPNLKELSVGTNKLMRKIDVQNCPNFVSVLDLSNCPSIEEVYTNGSSITGVNFPESGCLRIAQLPATITNLTIKHQLYIEELTIAGYDAIKTLWIEDCPTIDGMAILELAANVERLRLTGVNLSYDTSAEMLALASRKIGGIDENGVNIDTMWIDGTCHIKTLTGADYLTIKEAFPYMTITYDALTSELIFMSEDGTTELTRQTIQNGENGTDPVSAGTISTPTKTSTAQYTYSFAGWSLTSGGNSNSTALNAVEADRKVYVAFTSTIRTYTVKFYNETTLLQTVSNVPYGGTAKYTGSTPTNNSTGNTADFEFYGWNPAPTNIQGDTNCYAQFYDLREITDSWATIASNVANGTATSKYAVGAFKTLDIGAVDLPYSFYYGNAIVYNEEIHILGGSNGKNNHYKWDGTSWVSVSTLPYSFYNGSAVVFDGEIHILGGSGGNKKHYKWTGIEWVSVSTLPYQVTNSSAVAYNDELYVLGGFGSTSSIQFYKWNGTSWISLGSLPFEFSDGCAIVYNNEIHSLGGGNGYGDTLHYKWNGTEWTEVSTLPYEFSRHSTILYNNEIHIVGNRYGDNTLHYKWNGTEWTEVSTLPYRSFGGSAVVFNDLIYILGSAYNVSYHRMFYSYSIEQDLWSKVGLIESIPMEIVAHNHDSLPDGVGKWEKTVSLPHGDRQGCALLYNNEIHILGGYSKDKGHYKWDGTEWVSVSTLPYSFYNGSAVVFNNEIHILGTEARYTYHYKYDGTEWTSVSTLPDTFYQGSAVVYNNEIHIMGGGSSSTTRKKHYKWNGTEWTLVSTLPYEFYYGSAVIYNNEIHIMGSNASSSYTKHYKWNGTEWTLVSTLPYEFYSGCALIYNDEIHILGSIYSSTTRKKHYKWNGTEWTLVSTLPYEFYYGYVVIFDDKLHLMCGNSSVSHHWQCLFDGAKATLTFLARNLLSEPRKMHNAYTISGGWANTDLRKWLNDDFLSTLPSELQTAITVAGKLCDSGPGTSYAKKVNDSVWIPSENEFSVYPVFTTTSSRIRTLPNDTVGQKYWIRSSHAQSNTMMTVVTSTGGISYEDLGLSTAHILIGFCI